MSAKSQSLQQQIQAILNRLAIQGNLIDHPSASAEFNWKIANPLNEATAAILSAVKASLPEKRAVEAGIPYPITERRQVEAYNAALNEVREKLK